MDMGLTGKVAIVTGGSRGIGAASAEALAAQGAKVAVNFVQAEERARKVVSAIEAAGGEAMAVQADVRDAKAVKGMVASVIERFGRVDILVNNANISFPMLPFTKLAWSDFEAKLTGELGALYNCAQAVLPGMIERGSGKLVFISSSLSRHPGQGFSAHAAAKAAVDSLARVMALELGPLGVQVNVIGPGLVETDATAQLPAEVHEQTAAMTPLRRVAVPDDVAGAVVFLASPLSDYLTGTYIPVAGGNVML